MKIKVAILDDNKEYLVRITAAFTNRFADKLEIYSFSDLETAFQSLRTNRINVFIVSDTYDVDTDRIPKRCGFAYLVDSTGIETFKGQAAICRFQRTETIYKEILGIFSDISPDFGFEGNENGTAIVFASASGGAGSSTVAAAFAKRQAMKGKRVLYLNLEQFGNADIFFDGEGQFGLSDVVFAVKSKKMNLSLKLESYIKIDPSGVGFYSAAKNPLDIKEMDAEDIGNIIAAIRSTGSYDIIVIDADFSVSKISIELMKCSAITVFVSDGTKISNDKFMRAYSALETYEQQKDVSVIGKMCLIYNKMGDGKSNTMFDLPVKVCGKIPYIPSSDERKTVNEIMTDATLDRIFE